LLFPEFLREEGITPMSKNSEPSFLDQPPSRYELMVLLGLATVSALVALGYQTGFFTANQKPAQANEVASGGTESADTSVLASRNQPPITATDIQQGGGRVVLELYDRSGKPFTLPDDKERLFKEPWFDKDGREKHAGDTRAAAEEYLRTEYSQFFPPD
jgi:hypothetical protein